MKIWDENGEGPKTFDGTLPGLVEFLNNNGTFEFNPVEADELAFFPAASGAPRKAKMQVVARDEVVAYIEDMDDVTPDPVDAEALFRMLKNRMSIEVETDSPAYSGSVYLKVTLKLDDRKICSGRTSLPSIRELKNSEYDD